LIPRRLLLVLTFLSACIGPLMLSPANAQQRGSPRRIGVLLLGFTPENTEAQQFKQGLRDAGYLEGRDVVIEWRSAAGDYARLPALAAALVEAKSDVIVVESTGAGRAIKQATRTIPIVMAVVGDPVGSGLVTSLAHPGGQVTGLSLMTADLSAKRLQLLKEAVPRLARLAVLWNPETPFHTKVVPELQAAAPSLAVKLSLLPVRAAEELRPAFLVVSQARAQALYVLDDPIFFAQRALLLELASKARIPAIYAQREFAQEGGLMSYGVNFGDLFRRSAGYVDKILKGTKAGDLPIEQPTKFEFVINLKTAKALRITLPESIVLQADEVIR
jgi:putative tryptophan/tyrosine transport system substrate-binding protein